MNNSKQSNESTKQDKKAESVVKSISKQSQKGLSTSLFFFAFFTILSLIIAYLLPGSLIVTVPFVIIPSYFAFTSSEAMKTARNGQETNFFVAYKVYFSQLFNGGYRVFIGLLKSLLVYFLTNVALVTVFEYTVFLKIPEFKKIVSKIGTTDNLVNVVEQYNNFLSTNDTVRGYMLLISSISVVAGAIMFIHHIAKHSPKMRRNILSKQPVPMRLFNLIEIRVKRKYGKRIFKYYLKGAWFIQLIIVLVGADGILISYFLLGGQDIGSVTIVPLFMMFVFALPFMNYISKMQDIIYTSLRYAYEDEYIAMSLEFINKYKDKIDIETKDLEELESLLKKEQEKNSEDKDKEDEEKKDK